MDRDTVLAMVTSPGWEERLRGQYRLAVWLGDEWDRAMPVVEEFAHSEDELVNTAAVAPFGMKDYLTADPGRLERIMAVLDRQMANRSVPVRKNLGPYALGFLMRKYPDRIRPFIDRWARSDNEQVLWNTVMTFSQAAGKHHPEVALEILTPLAAHPSRYVWRAAASALTTVGRNHPRLVLPLMNRWASDPSREKVAAVVVKQVNPGPREESG